MIVNRFHPSQHSHLRLRILTAPWLRSTWAA